MYPLKIKNVTDYESVTGVKDLTIIGSYHPTLIWPTQTRTSTNTMISFSRFLVGLPKYSVSCNAANSDQILEAYRNAQTTSHTLPEQNNTLIIQIEGKDSFFGP